MKDKWVRARKAARRDAWMSGLIMLVWSTAFVVWSDTDESLWMMGLGVLFYSMIPRITRETYMDSLRIHQIEFKEDDQ
jgi:hypothetical protein